MKRLVFALAALTGIAHPAAAQHCGSYFSRGYVRSYAAPVVVKKEVAVATFVPLVVAVPAYGVGYPAAVAVPQATTEAKLEALLQRLEQQLGTGSVATPEQRASVQPQGDGAAAILSAHCAKCHTGEAAKGGFPIFQHPGLLASLDKGSRARILLECGENAMPPPPVGKTPQDNPNALSDAELAVLRQWQKEAK